MKTNDIISEIAKNKKIFILQVIFNVVVALISILTPLLEAALINSLVYGTIDRYFLFLGSLAIIFFLLKVLVSYFITKIEYIKITDIKYSLYKYILNKIYLKDMKSISKFDGNYLNSRLNTDIDTMVNFIFLKIPSVIQSSVTLLSISIVLYTIEKKVFIFFIFLVVIYILLYFLCRRSLHSMFLLIREENSIFYSQKISLFQRLDNIIIQSMEKIEIERLDTKFNSMLNAVRSNFSLRYIISMLQIFITFIFQVIFFWFGGIEVVNKKMSLGMFTATVQYFNTFVTCLDDFFDIAVQLEECKGALERINEILEMTDAKYGDDTILNIERIEFIDVNLKSINKNLCMYNNSITKTFVKGKLFILKGKNGVGKTSLIRTLVGASKNYYSGTIKINNILLEKINLKSLRECCISFMSQNSIPQDLTVVEFLSTYESFENYVMQSNSVANQIWKLFFGNDEKNVLNRKIDSFSGGEFQLLNLILTLSKPNSDVIILDEPFSNISTNMNLKVLDILNEISKNKIVIIVSHDFIPEHEKEIIYID